jgi:hypothetical protein
MRVSIKAFLELVLFESEVAE